MQSTAVHPDARPKRASERDDEIARGFIAHLEKLAGLIGGEANRAALARLRRTLGKKPDDAAEAYPYVAEQAEIVLLGKGLSSQGEEAEWCERCCYLVAALFAFYQTGEPRKSWHRTDGDLPKPKRNFGASFLRLEQRQRNTGGSGADETSNERAKNLERRFTTLLASRRADLPQRLRQAVSLLKSEDVPIDWVQLLADLQEWHGGDVAAPYRTGTRPSVQRRWAKSFWRVGALANSDAAVNDEPGDRKTNQTQEDES